MPLFATLLLQLHVPLAALADWSLRIALFAFAIWTWYTNRGREDAKTLEKRMKDLESIAANHDQRLTGYLVERERLVDSNNQRLDGLERRLSAVDSVLREVEALKVKVEAQNSQISKLERNVDKLSDKLDKILEMMLKK